MPNRGDIIAKAKEYIGTPWQHQGRLKGTGIDCIGLIADVGIELGLIMPEQDCTVYSRQPDGTLLRKAREVLIEVDIDDFSVGNIAVFWMRNPEKSQHMGIITDYGLIHTFQDVGKVVETKMPAGWKKQISAMFKYPGID